MSEALFGMGSLSVTILIAVVVAMVLVIGLVYWMLRRRGRSAFMRGGTNRQPRLAVLDAAVVDERRRLVLVRRDHVEHLVMIGGPSDIVVERGINRAVRPVQDAPSQQAQTAAQSRQASRTEPPQPARKQKIPADPPIAPGPVPATPAVAGAAVAAAATNGNETAVSETEAQEAPPKIPVTVPLPEPVRASEQPETTAPEATKREEQPEATSAVTAAAVSTALASAADQMARLEAESNQDEAAPPDTPEIEEVSEPEQQVEEPVSASDIDEPEPVSVAAAEEPAMTVETDKAAPTVELDEPVPEPARSRAGENVAPLELENIFDATSDAAPSDTKNATISPDIIQPPAANGNQAEDPKVSKPKGPVLADIEAGDDADASVLSAEELIADFDQLLEAEISKAKQQKPDVPAPETRSENVSQLQKQTLEDEMKKLLGDLSVKP